MAWQAAIVLIVCYEFADVQTKGQIMWSSQSPKLLHISPRWLVITDPQKKVVSAELKCLM